MSDNFTANYGTAICKKDLSLEVWDGSDDKAFFEKGDELTITYHEQDGSLGLTKDGIEYFCSRTDRKLFEEKWI